ncbi:hypothetical protein [Antarcticimicrobium luteum]|uniref:Uncharacterized protein n=1 Tax=Antarcticimicrobium luteum TaxID=2547397 RepID=A0A4R5V5N0_9RHOB|nr:hypothetical protein [Antarcticimicrobium luteum]TDK46786.1 hypothetical protein E1832_11855 [Antarcticimicrobium luteum]
MAVPLYGGPLLAGWMQAAWPLLAALAAMFFLAQILSGKTAARGDMPRPLHLTVLALTQVVLVLAVYAAGAGLSALTGALAAPLWLPLALTALGGTIYALHYSHDPQQDEVIGLLDQALASITNGASFDSGGEGDDPTDPQDRAAVQQAMAELWALPPDAGASELDKVVQRLEARVGHRAFADLLNEVAEGFAQVDRALLRYLASPAVRRRLIAERTDLRPAFALLLNSDDPGVQADLVALVQTLLEEDAPASALPPPEQLRDRAGEAPELARLLAPVEHAARKGG